MTTTPFAEAWTSGDTSATVLLAVVIDLFGVEALDWEIDTLREQLESRLSVRVTQREIDRYAALHTVLTTDMAYTDTSVFHHVVNALNGSVATFAAWDPVDLDELTWALTEILLNDTRKDEPIAQRFSDDVRRYVGLLSSQHSDQTEHLPAVIRDIADFGPMSPTPGYARDAEMYAAASQNAQVASADAEAYAQRRLSATIQALADLPLQGRRPDWQASLRAAHVG